jgi:type IV secretory pathway VirJ component
VSGTRSGRAGIIGPCLGVGVLVLVLVALGCTAPSGAAPSFAAVAPARGSTEVFNYDRFGAVSVYRGRGHPRDVVLFVSGDGGWDAGATSMAQRLAARGAVVAGIDIRHYRDQLEKASENCVSPSADFESLSHYLQSKLGLKRYLQPMLVGYGSGATLVYATLAEAPEGLFKGALSIGFCPALDLKKEVCKTPGIEVSPRLDSNGRLQGEDFSPAKDLPGKWIALQGDMDSVCPAIGMQKFAAAVPGSEVVTLPGVGNDYAIDKKWMPHYEAAYARLAALGPEALSAALPAAVADLPLTIVPAPLGSSGDWFGVFLTGDGGWVGLDKGVSAELAKHDIPIIGWDSLKYFWSRRTPEWASHDLDRVLRTYSHAWGRSHVLLIGYSQGADTMPFMVNRLPADTRELVGFTTLLGISDNAVWEFHVANWLGNPSKGVPTAPELERWSGSPYLCLYGESDGDAACAQLTGHDGSALKMPGGHHFGGGYAEIADQILDRLPKL